LLESNVKTRVGAYVVAFLAGAPLAPAQPARPVAEPEELGFEECGCGKAHALARRLERGLRVDENCAPAYTGREAFTDTDLISNDIDIEIDPATGLITGSNTMVVRAVVDGLDQFTFMLRGNYTVNRGLTGNPADDNAVTLNGTTLAPVTVPPGDNSSYARRVTLDRAYSAGEEFTIRVDYTGVAVSVGFGSIEFGEQIGVPIVATLSEPYYTGTWVPVKDGDVQQPGDNADKALFTLAVTAPDSLRTTSNGLLVGTDDVAPGKRTYRWRTDYPMATYLAAFSTTNYTVWTREYVYPLDGGGSGVMPVEFHIYPTSDTAGNRTAWERTLQMLATFRPIYGEYPFIEEKYGIYQFPFGGGMEHQTNSGQGTFNESVTAHELAHQWWGNDVTCRTWRDIWLNEGFATYGEALWQERKPGSSGLPALHSAMNSRRPTAVNNSVYVYNPNSVNRIFSSNYSYRKGAWVLHMLRKVVGDETFFAILGEFRDQFSGSAATTDEFVAVASAVAGRDLTDFFRQWVYGVGAPAYAFGWQNVTIHGQDYLRVSLRQTQNENWPGAGAPPGQFVMPIDVRIDDAGGSHTRTLDNTARTQHYLIPLDAPASGFSLDEFNWILATDKVEEPYAPGPARIVGVSPLPAQSVSAPEAIVVQFSEGVGALPAHFTLTGPGGSVACALAYADAQATLAPESPLAPGEYTLRVSGSMFTLESSLALDGEIVDAALPSGDGLPGGDCVVAFTVTSPPACDADINCDGSPDQGDVACMILAVAGDTSCICQDPDFNLDGSADQGDVAALIGVVAGQPCP